MARAAHICPVPGCSQLTAGRRCVIHTREADAARGTRQQRGYDRTHDQLRARWQRRLDTGEPFTCTNPDCLTPDFPVDPRDWHLGHDSARQHRGPEHPGCNLSTAGHDSHR